MKQKVIDSFYQGFSAEVESEQCGWIVNKYGISWQIVPRMFLDFAQKLSPTTYQQINQQILTMKKIEIAQIEKLIKRYWLTMLQFWRCRYLFLSKNR